MIHSLYYCVIPHDRQRYSTIGDYWEDPPGSGHWEVRVSDTGDWRMNFLVLHHELTELAQTENEGIAEPDIAAWDKAFEKRNTDPNAEPGEQPDCPIHRQHMFAEDLERLMCHQLRLEWNDYERRVMTVWRPAGPVDQDALNQVVKDVVSAAVTSPADTLRLTAESVD